MLQVVYNRLPLSVRMMTPLYHPSVNYMGLIAIMAADALNSYSRSCDITAGPLLGKEGLHDVIDTLLSQLKIYRFRTRHALTLRNCGVRLAHFP